MANWNGVHDLQYDAFDIGFITTDDFTNADILEAAYPAVAKRLHGDWIVDPAIPIVTGFLGKVFYLWYPHLYMSSFEVSYINNKYLDILTLGLEVLCSDYIR